MVTRRHFVQLGVGTAVAASFAVPSWRADAAEARKVGVLIPGSRSDKGWMESGYDGMVRAQEEHGGAIQVSVIENVSFADMPQALVMLASQNELVIGVGGQTEASVRRIARRFPHVKLSVVGGNKGYDEANIAAYDTKQAEIAFVAGAAAAMLSTNGGISYVGGLEIPAIVNTGKEFGNGARYINPDIKYFESFTGDFDDVAKAKEATLAAISQGADIHYHIMNLGLRGMEQAARENGTHMIGSYTSRCDTDPLYLAYTTTGVGFQVEYAIKQLLADSWEAGFKPFGLAMGPDASDITICSGATAEMLARLDAIKADILSGKIQTLES
jgi:basic membrane protein A and related proteins